MDKDGQPTTSAAEILEGAQLPFGKYKGCNIALMVELMAAGTGFMFGRPSSSVPMIIFLFSGTANSRLGSSSVNLFLFLFLRYSQLLSN